VRECLLRSVCLLGLLFTGCLAHGGHPWEWAGVFSFSTTDTHYLWSAEKKDGAYADGTMKFVAVSASSAAEAGLEGAEARALELWNGPGNWTKAHNGAEIQIGSRRQLVFDTDAWISFFKLKVDTAGPVAIFAEHLPTEFETKVHYLKDTSGADVEPAAQEPSGEVHAEEKKKDQWGLVILGAIITCIPAFLAITCLPCIAVAKLSEKTKDAFPAVHSFASGVVFAAAVFLLLPEGLHLAGAGQPEATGAAMWGSFILLGWFTGVLVHHATDIMFPVKEGPKPVADAANGVETNEKGDLEVHGHAGPTAVKPYDDNWRAIAMVVFFGDLFHNFSDGLVIGTAFKNCSDSFAWKLIGGTFGHELPQEMADIVVLMTRAGFKVHWALAFNFLSSLSTLIGALITYGTDVGMNGEGCILAYGAGVYLFLAVTELGPNVVELGKVGLVHSVIRLVPFVLGCVAMGLVLLGHEHCVPEGDGAGHHAH